MRPGGGMIAARPCGVTAAMAVLVGRRMEGVTVHRAGSEITVRLIRGITTGNIYPQMVKTKKSF